MPLTPEELEFFGTSSLKNNSENPVVSSADNEEDEFGEFQSADSGSFGQPDTNFGNLKENFTKKHVDSTLLDFEDIQEGSEKHGNESKKTGNGPLVGNNLLVSSFDGFRESEPPEPLTWNTEADLLDISNGAKKHENNDRKHESNGNIKSSGISIRDQMNDLSSYQTGMKFGQHMVSNKNPYTGEIINKPSTMSVSKWNEIVSAKHGENGKKQSTKTNIRSTNQTKPSNALETDDLIPQFDEWQFNDDFNSPVDEFSDFEIASSFIIQPPNELLSIILQQTLPLLANFLNGLVKLALPLRRQAMKRPEVATFIPGFLEIMAIAARISAGRARTSFNKTQRNSADIAANQLDDQWQKLSSRLRAVLPPRTDYSLPLINSRIIFTSITSKQCVICGLNKTEIVKGQSRPIWNDEPNGHRSCIKWHEKYVKDMKSSN